MNLTGRFAPSPTGPLHFGSLVAALGSYTQARSAGARWLVRIDDIDPPREARGAQDAILNTLEHFGFEWDALYRQSDRTERYVAALQTLEREQLLYGCTCTRRRIAATVRRSEAGFVYPGTCRGTAPAPDTAHRVIIGAEAVQFTDRVRGLQRYGLAEATGDFVVRRRDGLFAYHLACAVDDADGIGEVVRGADLLAGTAQQIYLQRLLGLSTPAYAHLPVALGEVGQKLSKQTGATPLRDNEPLPQLMAAWAFLGQTALPDRPADPRAFWRDAVLRWDLNAVPTGDRRAPAGP